MPAQDYWNEIGIKKDFEDPLYVDKVSPYLSVSSKIVEYGCGYGRMMRILESAGYSHLRGYDFSHNMIERGKRENPDLHLEFLPQSGSIPCDDGSIDGLFISTVLCCMIDAEEKKEFIHEILRVLRKGGILYVTDFLLCHHPIYEEKYKQGMEDYGKWGMYKTSEDLVVCHYTSCEILDLLRPFDIQWFEQMDFKTMNQNPARTFHCIARKA